MNYHSGKQDMVYCFNNLKTLNWKYQLYQAVKITVCENKVGEWDASYGIYYI